MVSQYLNLESALESAPSRAAAASPAAIPEERILDAAYEVFISYGLRRATMADIARRAGISRQTLYRRFANINAIAASVTTREFDRSLPLLSTNPGSTAREALVGTVVGMVRLSRDHPLLRKIIDYDPEFLLPYLLRRKGRTASHQLDAVGAVLTAGIAEGSIRNEPVDQLAAGVVLAAWSFALTGPIFMDSAEHADAQLTVMLDRYLRP